MSHWNFEIAGNQKIYFEIAGNPAIAGRFASLKITSSTNVLLIFVHTILDI